MEQLHAYFAQAIAAWDGLRWYHILLLLLLFGFVFGKKKVLDFEAKLFPTDSNEISGELEIEQFNRQAFVWQTISAWKSRSVANLLRTAFC